MSNLKCAVVFAALVTVSGIFPEATKAQVGGGGRYGNFRYTIPGSSYNPNLPPVTPDDSNVSEYRTLMSKAWKEQFDKENYQAAAQIYVRVIQKYPRSAQAYFNLGVLLKEHSNNREMSTKLLRTAYKLFQQEENRYMIEATEGHLRN